MVVALILGCAVPPAAAYALCAIIIIPTLIPLGVDILRAHMFCFYFAIIAAVTPPVGLASLAAAGISGGNYGITSLHAFRLCLSGFALPYFIVYNPIFSWNFNNPVWAVCTIITLLTGLIFLNGVLYGAMLRNFALYDWIAAIVGMAASFFIIIMGDTLSSGFALAVTSGIVALLVCQFRLQSKRPLEG